ncbi:MAG: glycosyltransferase family 39 protein [Patescibacteria group bacterium]
MLRFLKNKIFLIFAFALFLRLYGITHGFPFIYHVDEPALVRSAYNIRFDPNPHHFDWPHLYFYLNFLLYAVVYVLRVVVNTLGIRLLVEGSFPLLYKDPLIFYFLSRILSAFIGALTLIPLYMAVKELFNKNTALLAAFALAVFPHHVHASHFALIDVPATFFLTWVLYFSTKIYKTFDKKYFVLASLFSGFAASTKYNGGLAFLSVILAFIFYLFKIKDFSGYFIRKNLALPIVSIVFLVVGFFIGTPYALLDFKTFVRTDSPKGAFWQFKNVGKVTIEEYLPQLYNAVTNKYLFDFGVTYTFLFFVFVIYSLARFKDFNNLLFSIPGVIIFLYISTFDKNRIHYYMVSYPFICAGVAIAYFKAERHIQSLRLDKRLILITKSLFFLLVFALPFYLAIDRSVVLARKDSRNVAYEWLLKNMKPGQPIYYQGQDMEQPLLDLPVKPKKLKSDLEINKVPVGALVIITENKVLEDENQYLKNKVRLNLIFFESGVGTQGPFVYVFEVT